MHSALGHPSVHPFQLQLSCLGALRAWPAGTPCIRFSFCCLSGCLPHRQSHRIPRLTLNSPLPVLQGTLCVDLLPCTPPQLQLYQGTHSMDNPETDVHLLLFHWSFQGALTA